MWGVVLLVEVVPGVTFQSSPESVLGISQGGSRSKPKLQSVRFHLLEYASILFAGSESRDPTLLFGFRSAILLSLGRLSRPKWRLMDCLGVLRM